MNPSRALITLKARTSKNSVSETSASATEPATIGSETTERGTGMLNLEFCVSCSHRKSKDPSGRYSFNFQAELVITRFRHAFLEQEPIPARQEPVPGVVFENEFSKEELTEQELDFQKRVPLPSLKQQSLEQVCAIQRFGVFVLGCDQYRV